MEQRTRDLLAQARVLLESPVGQGTVVALVVAFALAACNVFAKTGRSPAAGLLLLVPGVNLLAFLWLAFAPWPVRRELRHLRKLRRVVHRADERHLRRRDAA